MADVQQQFDEFHDTIRQVDDATVREKREMLVDELRRKLPDELPSFTYFNQGSYAMHTRVAPLTGDNDIDVGLIFDRHADQLGDPVRLKIKIKDALDRQNRTVRIRRPCVTVQYYKDGEPSYHVDLAVYAKTSLNDRQDLACGKENSSDDRRCWDTQAPKEILDRIREAWPQGQQRDQFRRCVRCLKRWRDNVCASVNGPTSIALTCAAHQWFEPEIGVFSDKPNDLSALKQLVQRMLNAFVTVLGAEGQYVQRLEIRSVGYPYNDLANGMTDAQQQTLREKLESLKQALDEAKAEEDPHAACGILQGHFGADFPVPEKAGTAKWTAPPVITTGSSA